MANAWGASWASSWGSSWGAGAVVQPVIDHADGGYPWEAQSRESIERIRRHRHHEDSEKIEADRRLSRLVRKAYDRALGIEPEIAEEIAAVLGKPAGKPGRQIGAAEASRPADWKHLARDLRKLEGLLHDVEEMQRREANEAARLAAEKAEDEDIVILLMAA